MRLNLVLRGGPCILGFWGPVPFGTFVLVLLRMCCLFFVPIAPKLWLSLQPYQFSDYNMASNVGTHVNLGPAAIANTGNSIVGQIVGAWKHSTAGSVRPVCVLCCNCVNLPSFHGYLGKYVSVPWGGL